MKAVVEARLQPQRDKATIAVALDQLRILVLDGADEMLRMGFIDDVEAILRRAKG